mgnify:CR=1 FL=1
MGIANTATAPRGERPLRRRLKRAGLEGVHAGRRNIVPGIGITLLALSIVLAYQFWSPATEAFDAISRRIEATATLHQMLHESPMDDAVMLDAFLNEVASLLQDSAPPHVEIRCEAPAIALPTSLASPIAVITSEFVANSIKHAFGDDTPGTVRITGSGGGDEGLRIVCEDNGKAAERAAPNAKSVEGLGKRIMEASAAQIGATLEQGPGGVGYRMVLALPATGNC